MPSKELERIIYDGLSWWMRDAARLSDMGKVTEADHGVEYDKETVNRSVVYTRQDVVLMVSLLDSVNKQLRWVRWILIAILVGTTWSAIGGS